MTPLPSDLADLYDRGSRLLLAYDAAMDWLLEVSLGHVRGPQREKCLAELCDAFTIIIEAASDDWLSTWHRREVAAVRAGYFPPYDRDDELQFASAFEHADQAIARFVQLYNSSGPRTKRGLVNPSCLKWPDVRKLARGFATWGEYEIYLAPLHEELLEEVRSVAIHRGSRRRERARPKAARNEKFLIWKDNENLSYGQIQMRFEHEAGERLTIDAIRKAIKRSRNGRPVASVSGH
jgi:hypothetical protein